VYRSSQSMKVISGNIFFNFSTKATILFASLSCFPVVRTGRPTTMVETSCSFIIEPALQASSPWHPKSQPLGQICLRGRLSPRQYERFLCLRLKYFPTFMPPSSLVGPWERSLKPLRACLRLFPQPGQCLAFLLRLRQLWLQLYLLISRHECLL